MKMWQQFFIMNTALYNKQFYLEHKKHIGILWL